MQFQSQYRDKHLRLIYKMQLKRHDFDSNSYFHFHRLYFPKRISGTRVQCFIIIILISFFLTKCIVQQNIWLLYILKHWKIWKKSKLSFYCLVFILKFSIFRQLSRFIYGMEYLFSWLFFIVDLQKHKNRFYVYFFFLITCCYGNIKVCSEAECYSKFCPKL